MPELKYIHRGRGVVLLHNGRQYFKKKTYKNGACWWRCCKNLSVIKCLGSLTVQNVNLQVLPSSNDEIIKTTTHHADCVMDIAKNEWAEQMEACKQQVMSTDEPVPKIYEKATETFENTGYDIVHEVPSFEEVKVGLYKLRNKALNVPRVSFHKNDNISNIIIPPKFNDFLLADFNPGDSRRIVVFATKKAIQLMETIHDFFGDGTFKCCVPPFSQIYTIHGDCGSSFNTTNIRPLVYALMSHRDADAYQILFEMLRSQIYGWNPVKYTCDFEKSAIKALQRLFPEVTINGCYYHLQESLIRKAKALNMFRDKNSRRCVFLCRSLALLPKEKITAGWEYIEHQFNKKTFQPFLQYFKKFWLRPENMEWSVFGERHRTNNYAESFHTSLSKRIQKFNRNMFHLIAAFRKDADSKRMVKPRPSSVQLNDELICEAQLSMLDGQISVGHFLEMMR